MWFRDTYIHSTRLKRAEDDMPAPEGKEAEREGEMGFSLYMTLEQHRGTGADPSLSRKSRYNL